MLAIHCLLSKFHRWRSFPHPAGHCPQFAAAHLPLSLSLSRVFPGPPLLDHVAGRDSVPLAVPESSSPNPTLRAVLRPGRYSKSIHSRVRSPGPVRSARPVLGPSSLLDTPQSSSLSDASSVSPRYVLGPSSSSHRPLQSPHTAAPPLGDTAHWNGHRENDRGRRLTGAGAESAHSDEGALAAAQHINSARLGGVVRVWRVGTRAARSTAAGERWLQTGVTLASHHRAAPPGACHERGRRLTSRAHAHPDAGSCVSCYFCDSLSSR